MGDSRFHPQSEGTGTGALDRAVKNRGRRCERSDRRSLRGPTERSSTTRRKEGKWIGFWGFFSLNWPRAEKGGRAWEGSSGRFDTEISGGEEEKKRMSGEKEVGQKKENDNT